MHILSARTGTHRNNRLIRKTNIIYSLLTEWHDIWTTINVRFQSLCVERSINATREAVSERTVGNYFVFVFKNNCVLFNISALFSFRCLSSAPEAPNATPISVYINCTLRERGKRRGRERERSTTFTPIMGTILQSIEYATQKPMPLHYTIPITMINVGNSRERYSVGLSKCE